MIVYLPNVAGIGEVIAWSRMWENSSVKELKAKVYFEF